MGERGEWLSVGERQLVSLARAQIGNPGVLILDEATSAVDPATERRISEALRRLSAGRTTITIAHRLTTAEGADEIFVFDAGRIVERGTHTSSSRSAAIYAGLYRAGSRARSGNMKGLEPSDLAARGPSTARSRRRVAVPPGGRGAGRGARVPEPHLDTSRGPTCELPTNWYLTEVGDFFGTIWFRREFRVPPGFRGQRLFLRFGAVDYLADVWLNGMYLGPTRACSTRSSST